jgi:GTP-binding protein HflX
MEIDNKPIITVFNKIDSLKDHDRLSEYRQRFKNVVFTSALKGIGLNALRREIADILTEQEIEEVIRIPIHMTKQIAWLYERATVLDRQFSDGVAIIRYRAHPEFVKEIIHYLEKSDDHSHSRRG